jgi:hypothetical protein
LQTVLLESRIGVVDLHLPVYYLEPTSLPPSGLVAELEPGKYSTLRRRKVVDQDQ